MGAVMIKKKEVVVVIPVYKKKVDEFSKISLLQLVKVLNKYELCLMAPKSLDLSEYMCYHNFSVVRFKDNVFDSTASYSECLLDIKFYEKFVRYKYICIYQLDAFVFYDKLEYFCKLEYDYIGAPVPYICWLGMPTRVGNGGVSLRKVNSCIKLLREIDLEYIRRKIKMRDSPEDAIFSYCTTVKEYDFIGAPYKVAKSFAIDYDVQHIYRRLLYNMPFANHAWYKTDYNFWKPIIELYGYEIPDVSDMKKIPTRKKIIVKLLWDRLYRERSRLTYCCKTNIKEIFNSNDYAIWGWGRLARKYVKVIESTGIKISCVFDEMAKNVNCGLIYPQEQLLEKYKGRLLIFTEKYEKEITAKLDFWGWRTTEYISWSRFSYNVVDKYVRGLMRNGR